MARNCDVRLEEYFYSKHISIGAKCPEIVSDSFSLTTNLLDLLSEVRESIDAILFKDLGSVATEYPTEMSTASRRIIGDVIETKGVKECPPVYKRAKQNLSVNNKASPFYIVHASNVVTDITNLASGIVTRLVLFENDGKMYTKTGLIRQNNEFCFFGRSLDIEDLTELSELEKNVFLNWRCHKKITSAANVILGFTLRDAETFLKSKNSYKKFQFIKEFIPLAKRTRSRKIKKSPKKKLKLSPPKEK